VGHLAGLASGGASPRSLPGVAAVGGAGGDRAGRAVGALLQGQPGLLPVASPCAPSFGWGRRGRRRPPLPSWRKRPDLWQRHDFAVRLAISAATTAADHGGVVNRWGRRGRPLQLGVAGPPSCGPALGRPGRRISGPGCPEPCSRGCWGWRSTSICQREPTPISAPLFQSIRGRSGRQGPHQEAQKSTRNGALSSNTSSWKLESVKTATATGWIKVPRCMNRLRRSGFREVATRVQSLSIERLSSSSFGIHFRPLTGSRTGWGCRRRAGARPRGRLQDDFFNAASSSSTVLSRLQGGELTFEIGSGQSQAASLRGLPAGRTFSSHLVSKAAMAEVGAHCCLTALCRLFLGLAAGSGLEHVPFLVFGLGRSFLRERQQALLRVSTLAELAVAGCGGRRPLS